MKKNKCSSSPPVFIGICADRSLVLSVVVYRSFFGRLTFFVWSLCCLSFDLCHLIIPMVSSNVSYARKSHIPDEYLIAYIYGVYRRAAHYRDSC